MISFNTPLVLLFLTVGSFLIGSLLLGSPLWKADKPRQFLLINIGFLLLCYLVSPRVSLRMPMTDILLWSGLHFAFIQWLCRSPASRRKLLFGLWLAATSAWLIVSEWYMWNPYPAKALGAPHGFPLHLVTYTYIFVRQVFMTTAVLHHPIERVSWVDYVNYHFAFWTFFTGPLQRYPSFLSEQSKLGNGIPWAEAHRIVPRIAAGALKIFLVKNYLEPFDPMPGFLNDPSFPGFMMTLVLFPLKLYLFLSGICDIAIASARIAGFTVPEDYDTPFLARNMTVIWSRFHATLSHFFRDFIFFPVLMSACRRVPLALAFILAIAVTFFLMGQWHANQRTFLNWVVFGALLSLMVSTAVSYRIFLQWLLPPPAYERYQKSLGVRIAAVLLCQTCWCLAFLIYRYPLGNVARFFEVSWRHFMGLS